MKVGDVVKLVAENGAFAIGTTFEIEVLLGTEVHIRRGLITKMVQLKDIEPAKRSIYKVIVSRTVFVIADSEGALERAAKCDLESGKDSLLRQCEPADVDLSIAEANVWEAKYCYPALETHPDDPDDRSSFELHELPNKKWRA